ncbi:MAG: hypothetical protein J6Q48_02945 [Bacteroidaceae bacterium]|nr:hypothetical protein [Bacteroidaceae bacterium]
MPWLPVYNISGGMYGGRTCPAGSLTDLYMVAPNPYVNGNTAFAAGSRSTQDADYQKWDGSYGMTDDLLHSYLLTHDDGQEHEFDLIEIFIENPQGAQYYRQSIVFTVKVRSERQTIPGSLEQGNLVLLYYEIHQYEIARREYPTPYSAYVDTVLSSGSIGTNGYYHISGDEEIGGWLYYITEGVKIALGDFTFSNNKYFGCALYSSKHRADQYDSLWDVAAYGIDYQLLNGEFGLFDVPEEDIDPNEDEDEPGNEEDGGGGGHNRPVDDIVIPPLPDVGAIDAGFITMYHMTTAEMWVFAQNFFADNLLEILLRYFVNPMDIFVSAGLLPFTPTGNNIWYPTIGGMYITHQALSKVDEQFYEIDCGEIYVEKYGNNCFDFSPYTKIAIFLPYIGYRFLPVDDVMGQHVHVVYHCDVLSGDCIAFISTKIPRKGLNVPADVVIAQYHGNCLTQVPVGSVTFDQMVRGLIELSTSAASTAMNLGMGGNIGGSGLDSLAAATAHTVAGGKATTRVGGNIGSTAGYMSVQKPYIIRDIPNQSLPDNYGLFFGYPSNRSGKLGDGHFTGFAMVEDIQLNDIPAMETERAEILDWLKKGVLL